MAALIAFLLSIGAAWAGPAEDVLTAADSNLPTAMREEAYKRLTDPGSTVAVSKLIDDKDTSSPQRWVLIRSLGDNPSGEARDLLVKLLTSSDALVRIAVVQAMADRKDVSLTGRVAARLEDPAMLVRSAAAEALGRMKDPTALADLGRALADPSNSYKGTSLWVRRKFVDAMGLIGGEESVRYLARALEDSDPEVVKSAVRGLEGVAGFSFHEGRSEAQELEAWKRWASSR